MQTDNPQAQDFDGRVALVTGAASGMGAATAKELAARGARVVILDQNKEPADALAGRIDGMSAIVGDISDPAFCSRAVGEAVDRHGRLDVLVNCAGIIVRADAAGTSDDDWRRIIDVNIGG